MPVDPALAARLVHPESHEALRWLGTDELAQVNGDIAAGKVLQADGTEVTEPLEGALLAAGAGVLFPVRDGFPIMLVDCAISFVASAREG